MIAATDVAVIGGGPAGAIAARSLAQAGVPVLLVERAAEPIDRPGESLAPTATPLLQRLGLFDAFLATAPLPCCGNRSCWGGNGVPETYDFIRDRNGNGWHIDRRAVDRMLLDAARWSGAEVHTGASLRTVRRDGAGWLLGLSSGAQIRARCVIDAGGRVVAFARRLGVPRYHFDRLLAITLLPVSAGHPCEDSTTLIEAVPDGWWYSAPLPAGRLALAFMTDPDLLVPHGLRHWERLQQQLAGAPQTRARLDGGRYQPAGAPSVVEAGTSILGQVSGDGWLACGDAAAAYDPLSSHGIGAALSMGARAAEAAQAWLRGDETALDAYADRVRDAFARYLVLWRAYYAEETRWPEAAFWARRNNRRLDPSLPARAAAHG